MQIADQTILISGGAGSIGSFLSERLYSKAAHIILLDMDAEKLKALKDQFNNISVYTCNLSNGEEVVATCNQIFSSHKVTVLINNAGLIHSEPLINILNKEKGRHDFQKWNEVMQANLYSTFYLTSCIAEMMVKQRVKGLIINVSSIAAQGNIGQSAYSAAKAGIEALTKTWTKELGIFKIRCACIAPGFINTASTQNSLSEAVISKWQKAVPLGKLGELNDIGKAIEFIIDNDYFNGKVLQIDGGLTI